MDKSLVKYLGNCTVSVDFGIEYGEDYLVNRDGSLVIIGFIKTSHCTSILVIE